MFDLSGTAARLLKTLTPTQVSLVVEALGKAGVKDAELFGKLADQASVPQPALQLRFKYFLLTRAFRGHGLD